MKGLIRALLAAAGLLCGCATNPVTGHQDLVLMSEQDEIALGQQAAQQVLQQYRVYGDAELQNYVQYVGSKVAANSQRPNLTYHFTVLDSREVNAFALPGGWIYITRGILSYLNSEAELAAVLGHEIGHVCARHAVRQQTAAQLTQLGTAIGAAFIPGLGQAGYQMAGVFGEALLRGYGRDMELEADRLGAEYLARTHYDPDAMLSVLRTLKGQETLETRLARAEGREPQVYHGLFATHPDSDTRLQEAIANARHITATASPQIGRDDYLQRIEGLPFGDDTSQGLVRGRDFYQGALGFAMRFPPGWKIDHSPDRVLAAAPGGEAIMQLTRRPADPRLGPREFMTEDLKLPQLGTDQDLQIHGFPAHTATAAVNTQNGRRTARLTVIYFGNNAFVLAGITREPGALANFDGDFIEAARSFRALSPDERKAADRTERIHLLRADSNTRFPALASQSPLRPLTEEQLRLLNGRFPEGDIRPGELIKTVQ